MTLLAIETSTLQGSVCLRHAETLYTRDLPEPHSQAAQLVPAIESLLAEAGTGYRALQGLAVTIGPGSFTGLRIGLAVARAIAWAHPMTLYPFTTLECLAAGYSGAAECVCATLKAGKGELYVQHFRRDRERLAALGDIGLLAPASLQADGVLLGNTQALTGLADYAAPERPHARDLLTAIDCLTLPEGRTLKPLYIRPPDAKLPTSKPI